MDRWDKREKMSSVTFSTTEWKLFTFFLNAGYQKHYAIFIPLATSKRMTQYIFLGCLYLQYSGGYTVCNYFNLWWKYVYIKLNMWKVIFQNYLRLIDKHKSLEELWKKTAVLIYTNLWELILHTVLPF